MAQRGRSSPIPNKNATPSEGARAVGAVFGHVRPHAVLEERSAEHAADVNAKHAAALSQYSQLRVQTGSTFIDQWRPQYVAEAPPVTFTYAVGGPEFVEKPQGRGRRAAYPRGKMAFVGSRSK